MSAPYGTIYKSSPPKIIHHETIPPHCHPQIVSTVVGLGVSQWILHIYIYRERERERDGFLPYKLLLSTGSPLRGNPFSGSWLWGQFFLSVGSPLRGNSFCESWLFVYSSFCRGIHFQNSDFSLVGVLECVSAPPGSIFNIWSICANAYASKTRIDILCKKPVPMPQDVFCSKLVFC